MLFALPLLSALLLPPASAAARAVTPPYAGNCQRPAWAPDGGKLAYEVNYHDKQSIELYVYTPGTGRPRQVLPVSRSSSDLTAGFSGASAESVAHEPAWGPASVGRFVYSGSTSRKDYDLFIDGAGALAPAPGTDGGAAWSPTGTHIAFTSARSGQGDLYLVNLGTIDAPPLQLTKDPSAAELYAAFSPDGSQIAYVGHTDQGDNLYVLEDLASPTPRRITDWPRTQTRPSWSPDGERIAFYANQDAADRFDLFVMNLSGGRPFPVARGVVLNSAGPTWTPDGTGLVYVLDDDSRFDPVYLAPVADPGKARRVDSGTVGNSDLDVVQGSDGRVWLAVAAQGLATDRTRDFKRIYVMPLGD